MCVTQDEAGAEHTEPGVSVSLTAVRSQPEQLRQVLSKPGIWKGPPTVGLVSRVTDLGSGLTDFLQGQPSVQDSAGHPKSALEPFILSIRGPHIDKLFLVWPLLACLGSLRAGGRKSVLSLGCLVSSQAHDTRGGA